MNTLAVLLASLVVASSVKAQMKIEPAEYRQADAVLEGFIAYDAGVTTPRPGVVIVHDYMGVSDYVKMRAEQIVKLGYVAFVADIYGKGVHPTSPEEASKQAGKFRRDIALMRARAQAAIDELKKRSVVDPKKVAAMGYCFGGGVALELARSGADIAGVISFHGSLNTPNPEDAKNIKGSVLVLHGADDPHVKAEVVHAFQEEMRNAKVDWQFVSYGGAVHAFTQTKAGNDPSKGAAYNALADQRSFEEMTRFLREIFSH